MEYIGVVESFNQGEGFSNVTVKLESKESINFKATPEQIEELTVGSLYIFEVVSRVYHDKEQLVLAPCAQLFLNQKTPIFVSGRWSVPKIESQAKFKYGILPFPSGSSKYYIPLNSSGWAVYKNSKNKKAAIDFVKYISSDENIEKITKSGLITPAKKKIAFSEAFKKGEVFTEIIEKSTPNIVPADYNVLIDKINIYVTSVLSGFRKAKDMKL